MQEFAESSGVYAIYINENNRQAAINQKNNMLVRYFRVSFNTKQ